MLHHDTLGVMTKYNEYSFKSTIWLYPGMASWHFISVPKDITKEIKERFADRKRGWGSLKVSVTIGKTTWNTSIFPDNKEGIFLLPIKADIRKKEHLHADMKTKVMLKIIL